MGKEPHSFSLEGIKLDVITDVFKLYLRKQQESLLPTEVYDHFTSMLKLITGFASDSNGDDNSDDKTEILVQLCQKLPSSHKPILRRLLQLLWEIHIRADINKMNADNLRYNIQYSYKKNKLIKRKKYDIWTLYCAKYGNNYGYVNHLRKITRRC